MFLEKEKDPTSKQFDDDEWVRSLTKAQKITADVTKDSASCQSEKGPVHSNGRILAEAPRAQ